jgi:hypothetical protein
LDRRSFLRNLGLGALAVVAAPVIAITAGKEYPKTYKIPKRDRHPVHRLEDFGPVGVETKLSEQQRAIMQKMRDGFNHYYKYGYIP